MQLFSQKFDGKTLTCSIDTFFLIVNTNFNMKTSFRND